LQQVFPHSSYLLTGSEWREHLNSITSFDNQNGEKGVREIPCTWSILFLPLLLYNLGIPISSRTLILPVCDHAHLLSWPTSIQSLRPAPLSSSASLWTSGVCNPAAQQAFARFSFQESESAEVKKLPRFLHSTRIQLSIPRVPCQNRCTIPHPFFFFFSFAFPLPLRRVHHRRRLLPSARPLFRTSFQHLDSRGETDQDVDWELNRDVDWDVDGGAQMRKQTKAREKYSNEKTRRYDGYAIAGRDSRLHSEATSVAESLPTRRAWPG